MFKAKLDQLFIVCVMSNTPRFKRRWELFKKFVNMVRASGVDLVCVELAFGHRNFMTDSLHPSNLHLRTIEEFWHKENLINLGVAHGRRLWPKKKMVAWIDADCFPIGTTMEHWFSETWHELQHYEFVQMWEWLQPLDYHHNPLCAPNPSFMSNYIKFGTPYPKKNEKGYPAQWGSPGLAWAANLSAFDQIGGLGDAGITGGGDWYLAHMLISDLPFADFKKGGYTQQYVDYWEHRQDLADRWIKRDVGFVKGLYGHWFHGKTVNRQYNTREQILVKGKFRPDRDLKKDHQGLWQLETHERRQIWIRDELRKMFRARNEDSIDSF
jgi:hypothetical protein